MGFGEFTYNLEKYRYIATEFISGESVLDRMKRSGPLNEFDATFVILKLAEIANKLQAEKDLKASAKAKLIAGEPLTAEEADTIVL